MEDFEKKTNLKVNNSFKKIFSDPKYNSELTFLSPPVCWLPWLSRTGFVPPPDQDEDGDSNLEHRLSAVLTVLFLHPGDLDLGK